MKKIIELDLLNMEKDFKLCQKTAMTNQFVEYEHLAPIPIERVQMV